MRPSVRNALKRGLDPVRLDCLVAVLLLCALQIEIWAGGHQHGRVEQALIAITLTVAVAIRRRWMLEALLLACAAFVVKLGFFSDQSGQGGALGLVALLLLFYGAGAFLDERRAWFALAISVALGTAVGLSKSGVIGALFGVVAFVLLPWTVGRARRLALQRERAARELAERVDSERELHVRAAALGERARLAREIHDVIAHSVSVMVIQAAGARTVMDLEPDRAETALRSVERAGREALAEMRRLLGVLADGKDPRALAPQPGLEDLPELVASTRSAGLRASIRIEGEPVAVSPGLSLCAYRVVQEALTNTLKHAGATRAQVNVSWCPGALELEVIDAGGERTEPAPGSSGHGIAGMCERAALHGGTVEAGPAPGGGFVVQARIPLLAGTGK
jgi:signal transduction histidine kinase